MPDINGLHQGNILGQDLFDLWVDARRGRPRDSSTTTSPEPHGTATCSIKRQFTTGCEEHRKLQSLARLSNEALQSLRPSWSHIQVYHPLTHRVEVGRCHSSPPRRHVPRVHRLMLNAALPQVSGIIPATGVTASGYRKRIRSSNNPDRRRNCKKLGECKCKHEDKADERAFVE